MVDAEMTTPPINESLKATQPENPQVSPGVQNSPDSAKPTLLKMALDTNWRLFNEATAEFAGLPSDLKEIVQNVNDRAADSPSLFTRGYLTEVLSDIEKTSADRPTKKEIARRLEERAKMVEEQDLIQRKAEERSHSPKQVETNRRVLQEVSDFTKDLGTKTTALAASMEPTLQETTRKGRNEALFATANTIRGGKFNQASTDNIEALRKQIADLRSQTRLLPEDEQLADSLNNYLEVLSEIRSREESFQSGGMRGRDRFSEFFSEEEDRRVIAQLSDPEKIIGLFEPNDPKKFAEFERQVVRLYGAVLRIADQNPDVEFDRAFNQLIHTPIMDEIVSLITAAEDAARARGISKLADNLSALRNTLATERGLRSYTHNASLILQTRGNLENLAGYAERFRAGDLDYATRDPIVMKALHLIEQKTNQELTNNNWVVPQEFMQSLTEEGGVRIDKEVMEMLRKFYRKDGPNKIDDARIPEDWEIQRAYRIAKGISLGVTAVVLDRLGEADAPNPDTFGGYKGYFGESILSAWNPMRHHFLRWGLPNEASQLMYAAVREYGSLRGWDHDQLKEFEKEFKNLKGSEKFEKLLELSGTPLIEYQNLFGVGGPLTRAGWRLDAASFHLLVPKDATVSQASLISEDENELDRVQYDTAGGAIKNLENVNWEASWKKFRRAGAGIMYHWAGAWSTTVAEIEAKTKGLEGEAKKEFVHHRAGELRKDISLAAEVEADAQGLKDRAKHEYVQKRKSGLRELFKIKEGEKISLDRLVFEHIRDVNPLKYAYYEKENMHDPTKFANSLRGQAIRAVFGDVATIADRANDIRHLEENMLLVQEAGLQRAQKTYDDPKSATEAWGVRDEDFSIIEDGAEREQAKTYWRTLVAAINAEGKFPIKADPGGLDKLISARPGKGTVKRGDAIDYLIAQQGRRRFFIGSEDMDLSQLHFKRAGQSMIGRVFKDANGLSQGVHHLQSFDGVLTASAVSKNYDKIIEAIDEATKPIIGVHGPHAASSVAYKMAVMAARYYQKDLGARMPLGIGTLVDTFRRKTALSKDLAGRQAWRWDEEVTYGFIEDLFKHRILTDEDRDKLKKELGGTEIQMGIDIMRTTIPLVILFIIFQAIQAETKE